MTTVDHDPSTRYAELVARLDLPAKVRLLTGETAFTLPGEQRIGLAPLAFSDGPTGVRGLKFAGGDPVALLPNATLISGSWDDEIAAEVGVLLAQEAHRQDIHVVLGPTINLHRSPLGGRLFEAYSEDPYLTGRTAAAYVRAMQARGTAACLKHLVANESETLRNFVDSRVDEITLRELYLLPFRMAVQDADAWSMMAAYNDVNGRSATENRSVQQEIVKDEWGWDGLIMSDWFAVKRTVASADGGLDLVMPGPDGPWGDRLVAAVRRGDVAEATVDDHLVRLLRLADRTGALGAGAAPPSADGTYPAPDAPPRRAQLRRIATRGMVLVKNDGDVLPLAGSGSLALVGRHALETQGMGGGSAQVTPPHLTGLADAARRRLGDRVQIVDGVGVRSRPVPATPGFVTDPVTGRPGMRVTYLAADGRELATRHSAGTTITVGWDDDFAEPPASVVLSARLHNRPGAVRVGALGVGRCSVRVGDREIASGELRVTGFDPGEAMLQPPYLLDTVDLPADASVSVRLDIAAVDWRSMFAAHPELDVVDESHLLTTGSSGAVALIAGQRPGSDDEALAAAEAAAAAAGTAVVVVGLTEENETEAVDKATLALPGRQDELVRRVAAAAGRTVVVVNAATPVLMPWLAEVDAVLVVGLPGQEAGDAILDVLTGAAEPTGRLVTSYPVRDGAAPAWTVTPDDDLGLAYTEGLFIGYRGYAAGRCPEPLFWFGHGLGYGRWRYDGADLLDGGAVRVRLANVGARTSRETVQVYFKPDDTDQPVRLVGYAGIELAAGASGVVEVAGDPRLRQRWSATDRDWVPIGPGELLVARGLGDVRLRLRSD